MKAHGGHGATEGSGPVDRWLDEAFDQMAGTGAAGRRTLAEAEDHLLHAVADSLAQGLPQEEAELEAVRRFGSPAMIAASVQRWPLSDLRGIWLPSGRLLAVACLLFFGGYGLLVTLSAVIDEMTGRMITYGPTRPLYTASEVAAMVVMVVMVVLGLVLLRRFKRSVRAPRGRHWLGMAVGLAIAAGVTGYVWAAPWRAMWLPFGGPEVGIIATGLLGFATVAAIRRIVTRALS